MYYHSLCLHCSSVCVVMQLLRLGLCASVGASMGASVYTSISLAASGNSAQRSSAASPASLIFFCKIPVSSKNIINKEDIFPALFQFFNDVPDGSVSESLPEKLKYGAKVMNTIDIGSRKIGAGQPTFVIAEAGINHQPITGFFFERMDESPKTLVRLFANALNAG